MIKLEIYRDNIVQVSEVENIIVFDMKNGGELGIYNNHISWWGMGKYIIYNNRKIIYNFLYNINGNIIKIYTY